MQGTVKFFHENRGWGFIASGDKDYFVHYSQINMKGRKLLLSEDIVNFEVSDPDENGKIQAVNVQPILTRQMIVHELAKEGLHIMRIGDDKGIHGWYVVDKSDKPVVDKEMDLLEVAAYAGFSISEE